MICLKCLTDQRKKARRLSEKQRVFTQMVCLLVAWAVAHGYELTYSQAYRPPALARLYKKLKKGIANSKHCMRLAVDFNLFIGGVYQAKTEAYLPLGKYWKSIGGTWGGDFKRKDGNHFGY